MRLRGAEFLVAFSLLSAIVATGTPQDEPLRVGGDIRAPRKVHHVPPIYPAAAKLFAVEGVVIMETSITEVGTVGDIRVLRSIPLLDKEAVETVKQWRYKPTLLNGDAVPIVMTVTVNFSLGNTSHLQKAFGDSLLEALERAPDDEHYTWPEESAVLELTDYELEELSDGSRSYRGRITNISSDAIPNLKTVVVQRERSVKDGAERELLRPTIQEMGRLDEGAATTFRVEVPNDGSWEFEKLVLLFVRRDTERYIPEVLLSTRGLAGALGREP